MNRGCDACSSSSVSGSFFPPCSTPASVTSQRGLFGLTCHWTEWESALSHSTVHSIILQDKYTHTNKKTQHFFKSIILCFDHRTGFIQSEILYIQMNKNYKTSVLYHLAHCLFHHHVSLYTCTIRWCWPSLTVRVHISYISLHKQHPKKQNLNPLSNGLCN